jgi:hypothetical protein
MQQIFQLAAPPIYQADKPVRNDLYRRFVKRCPCVVCGATLNIGSHGLSQESSDQRCILLGECHSPFDYGRQGFAPLHHLNLTALIQEFSQLRELRQRRTA